MSTQLLELCARFRPRVAVIADAGAARAARRLARARTRHRRRAPAPRRWTRSPPTRLGHGGRRDRRRGRRVLDAGRGARRQALAAGEQGIGGAGRPGAGRTRRAPAARTILPIDSEHNAIFQCLPRRRQPRRRAAPAADRLRRTVPRPQPRLAARRSRRTRPARIPNWVMGRKISVDSATLMNKGLEVIEAHHLFGVAAVRDRSAWCIRRASSIRWSTTSTARCSRNWAIPTCAPRSPTAWPGPSASIPASRRSTWPRWPAWISRRRTCEAFPCLGLAYAALRAGGSAPAILNAANEVAVAAFLERPPALPRHPRADRGHALARCRRNLPTDLDVLLECDDRARRRAEELLIEDGQAHERILRRGLLVHRHAGRAGDLPRIRPLLGRAPLRRQGAALLGRLRPAAVVARRRRTAPATRSR